MLYPPVATQLPSNVSNSIRRFDFLERNNNTQGVNKHNISQHNSSSADVESLMTAGANISVVTANNAATLPYTASEDRASTGDDLSPSSVIKMDSSGTPIGVVTSDDCSGVMGESGSPTPPQTLTLRLIMQGKEVGSIIGKRGDTIKKFRTESGARINISDGQSIERIVTLTGASECLNKAFAMISYKFEEDMSEGLTADCPKPPVTLRLIVPASQCGSIIGKGGSKIKEIREHTGCTIQVAGDYLPQSTERAVTISGMPEAITKCIMEICKIMSESPPKGQTLPYRPKPISSMVAGSPIIANTHPAAAHHPFATASPNFSSHAVAPGMTGNNFLTSAAYGIHPAHHAQFLPSTQNELAKLQAAQLSSLYGSFLQPATMMQLGASPLMGHAAATPLSPSSAGSASGGASHSSSTTQELNIPNDVIGCVIGPHGNRINDISSSSGSSSVAQEWHPTSSEPQPHPTAHSNLSATSHHFHQHQHHQAQHNIAAAAYLNNLAAYQSAAIYWPWFISAATAASAYQQHPPSFHIGGVTHYSPLTQVPSAASADTHISVHPLSSTTTTPITTSGSVQSGNSGNNQNSTQISSAPQQ